MYELKNKILALKKYNLTLKEYEIATEIINKMSILRSKIEDHVKEKNLDKQLSDYLNQKIVSFCEAGEKFVVIDKLESCIHGITHMQKIDFNNKNLLKYINDILGGGVKFCDDKIIWITSVVEYTSEIIYSFDNQMHYFYLSPILISNILEDEGFKKVNIRFSTVEELNCLDFAIFKNKIIIAFEKIRKCELEKVLDYS